MGQATVNPDEHLTFEGQQVHEADLSGRRLVSLTTIGSVFERCRFERMRVESANLGAGVAVSEFVDCSFDGSRIRRMGGGFMRFVRCSFRGVDLQDWDSMYTELVDCTITGRLRSVQFWGKPLPPTARNRFESHARWCEREGREPPSGEVQALFMREGNEFHGNDFSGAEMEKVYFRYGIDLDRQRLPVADDYLYLRDARVAIDGALELLAQQTLDNALRGKVDAFLREILGRNIDEGQGQLFIRAKNFQRRGVIPPDVAAALDLLRSAMADEADCR